MPELRQEYLDILEKRDWSVSSYTDDGRVEIEWYSPAGEDFIIFVGVEKFPDEVLDYSDSFDVDEHIAMWIPAKRKLAREFKLLNALVQHGGLDSVEVSSLQKIDMTIKEEEEMP